MKKKKIIIIITIILLIIGSLTIIGINFHNMSKEEKNEELIKKSTYTLEELYSIVEKPEELNELLNNYDENGIAYIMFHFYDYFSESTPFKTVKLKTEMVDGKEICIKENGNYIIESIDYIDYYEYMRIMENFIRDEKNTKEKCKQSKEKHCNYAYASTVKYLIYGTVGL